MKRIKRLLVGIAALLCLPLCGCSMLAGDTAELLSPPELSGDIAPIAAAIAASAGGEYTLKYPSKGNFRSAVIQNDINGDGTLEAFAFYSRNENNVQSMNINIICSENGKWVSAAQQKITAGGVERIDFCDLDGDGVQEILVGWEIYGASEMQLGVYSFKNNRLVERTLQKYSSFVCCDLNDDGTNEALIINLNSAEQLNSAALYSLDDSGFKMLYYCELDKTVKSISEPVVSTLSSGKTAVYIDETKGIGAVTEVLFVDKNGLVNPLLNFESRETVATLRASGYGVMDINRDGIAEIPVQESVPSVIRPDSGDKLYLINWCSYNGETLTNQVTALMNDSDGYYYILSSKWSGQIAVLRDSAAQLREIYSYDNASDAVGEMLISFKTVKKSDWDKGEYKKSGYAEITHDGVSSYICKIGSAAGDELTLESVRKSFKLLY